MADPYPARRSDREPVKFVIGVDFGTTYTGVSWILTTGNPVDISQIKTVDNWPGVGSSQEVQINKKVPSVYTYSALDGGSWGYCIKDTTNVIAWTKLQLKPPTKKMALEVLLKNLREVRLMDQYRAQPLGPPPTHLIKQPVDVLHDFMIKVTACVKTAITNEKPESTLRDHPIDLVITHPAQWPIVAINHTMRAVIDAFDHTFRSSRFGDVMLATEPEACAQMTMRDAVRKKITNLQEGDCVVIVDAGGGTVDVVSCQVTSLDPFRIVPITTPTSGEYGSTKIEKAFREDFLPRRLASDYGRLINQAESSNGHGSHVVLQGPELRLVNDFISGIKHTFAGPPELGRPQRDYYLPINADFDISDSPERGIENSNLRITCDDLVEMFRVSVNGTLELIREQLTKIDLRPEGGNVTDIFLSGGFSANDYLFEKIKRSTGGRNINVVRSVHRNPTGTVEPMTDPRRGEDESAGLTAVSRGAVLLGLGLGCDKPLVAVRCPVHIGVVISKPFDPFNDDKSSQFYVDSLESEGRKHVERAKNHIHWVVARGDLIGRKEGIKKTVSIIRRITADGNKAGQINIAFSHETRASRLPRKWDGSPAVEIVTLPYDLGYAFKQFGTEPLYSGNSPENDRFASPRMEVQIQVNQQEAVLKLVIDSRQKCMKNPNIRGTLELHGESRTLFEQLPPPGTG